MHFGTSKFRPVWLLIFLLLLFQASLLLVRCDGDHAGEDRTHLPSAVSPAIKVLDDDMYAGTDACIECHRREYDDWLGSHHDEAMMVADKNSVKGDFSDVVFRNQGVTTRFYREGEKYMVNTEGPDGQYGDYEVVYTFGIEPLQQYIVKFPAGKYQCLRIAWDTEKEQWFDLYPDMKIATREWLHWTKGSMTWNTACADCHSTNLRKNYLNEPDSFHTAYTIIDVSCEACHGPSKDHVDFVRSPFFDSTRVYNASRHMDMLTTDEPQQQVDDCARCHSRRVQITKAYNHQGAFRDHYAPEILRDHLYFPDGQILDEDYVYSSFVQTKMYMNHVKCSNCHNPHSTGLILEGNQLCLQCHEPATYDTYSHHFHEDVLGGQECISCHMDGRYYMVNDYRRDHSFRVPRPDLSVRYDVPNACNSCHSDQTAGWAAGWVEKWYGPDRTRNYADVLSLGSTRDESAVAALDTLAASRNQPPIVRATAVWYLGFIDSERSNQAIIRALGDPDPTVRYIAAEVMQNFPPEMRYQYLTPLLEDPVRSVRVMAFDALTDIPPERFHASYQKTYDRVLTEYREMLDMRADFPGGQLQLARYLERRGKDMEAEKALLKAIAQDSLFNAARINLAHLYHGQGSPEKAIDLFRLVTRIEPDYGPAYYSLGLLFAEQQDMDKAISYLRQALEKDPENPRIYYNLGLALQQENRKSEAAGVFNRGLEQHPENGDLMYALIILYIQQEAYQKARDQLSEFRELFPRAPQIRELEAVINRGLNGS